MTAGQSTGFTYATNAGSFITGTTQASDASPAYPPAPVAKTGTYNNLNQLTNLTVPPTVWDADGNLKSDGLRTYKWDAENRLTGISYTGVSGKATAFTYDGLGRRSQIASTPAGGGTAATTNYVWCGAQLCQALTAAGAEARGYYAEGEFVPGSPSTSLYYAPDNLGSVRRVFGTTGSPSYDYDPYGAPNQITAPVTDFNYAGTLYNADSGLYLTTHRPYDPATGRFLSRDPIGESGDPEGNLYVYVGGDPIDLLDPGGLERKRGRTPNKSWPPLPPNLCPKKGPKWNPEGYWEGAGGGRYTWDDRTHGTGEDRGNGPQGGHWDDENSDNRYDENGNPLPGSPDPLPGPALPPETQSKATAAPQVQPSWWGLLVAGFLAALLLQGGDESTE